MSPGRWVKMMAREPKRIIVAPGTELARLLDDAASSPVLLEKDGELYRLNRAEEEDVWASYDPQKVREAVAKHAGSWKDIDLEAFKAFIYRAREEGTKPLPAP